MGFKGFPVAGLEQFVFTSVKPNKQKTESEKHVCSASLHCKLLQGQTYFSLSAF